MTLQQLTSRLRKILDRNIQFLADDMKRDILKAFDQQFGYGPRGGSKKWPKLKPSTIATRKKFGYGASPQLVRSGKLRKGIDVRYDKKAGVIRTGNFSKEKTEALYPNDKPIPVREASRYLEIKRPHTEPPKKYYKQETIERYLYT